MLFKIYESLTGGKSKGWDHWLQEVKLKYMFLSVSISFPAATSALSVAARSYPTSEVGAAAESARLRLRRNGREELLKSEVRAAARRSYPTPEARGRGPGGPTPGPKSRGSAGAGGPRGAIPH